MKQAASAGTAQPCIITCGEWLDNHSCARHSSSHTSDSKLGPVYLQLLGQHLGSISTSPRPQSQETKAAEAVDPGQVHLQFTCRIRRSPGCPEVMKRFRFCANFVSFHRLPAKHISTATLESRSHLCANRARQPCPAFCAGSHDRQHHTQGVVSAA